MSTTIKALGLERLSPAERILLAGELWDSVTTAPGISLLTDAHREDFQDNKVGGEETESFVLSDLRGRPGSKP